MPLKNLPPIRFWPAASAVMLITMAAAEPLHAKEGDPIALRLSADGSCSVENLWGLSVVIEPRGIDRQLAEESSERVFVDSSAPVRHRLSRPANQDDARWQELPAPNSGAEDGSAEDIVVERLGPDNDQPAAVVIHTDGAQICVSPASLAAAPQRGADPLPSLDALVLTSAPSIESVKKLAQWGKPLAIRTIVVPPSTSKDSIEALADAFDATATTTIDHNTVAVASSEPQAKAPQIIQLSAGPWKMPEHLAPLFESMEQSCSRSQKVFAKLSAAQLNFRPSNGTHTPRWNAEHMMGRQLLFFSQIYHAVDPVIQVMDLNPKQMPPDYSAAHPEWDGKEEARQMQRVSDFTRRFAYLLEEVPLQGRAPGSRWSLEGLLKQMSRHYDEHTANTVKKFELSDFPKQ